MTKDIINSIPKEGADFKNRPYKEIPIGKALDITGEKKNYLTPLFRIEAIDRNGSYWLCQCDCGNITIVPLTAYKKETQKSCGCWHRIVSANQKFNDLTGKTFGDLYVESRNIEYAEKEKNKGRESRAYWNCVCICGRKVIRSTHSLTNTNNHSNCGHCYRQKDYTGFKTGLITALYSTQKLNKNNAVIWHCKCDCGNEFDADTNILPHLFSCGCAVKSKGEYIIENILKENHIKYIYNKAYFKDLCTPRGGICRYDFILLDDNDKVVRLIEFDGEQHYNKTSFLNTEHTEENDNLKNNYAKQHNYPLVRIPYWERDKITLETIMSDKYLIT